MQENKLALFEEKEIRKVWHENDWYFSIVDTVMVLMDSEYQQARNYWKVLKLRLKQEGNETVTNCNQLKMKSKDGKSYNTDAANTEQLLKAEPFKLWLAQVGSERLEEIVDPEKAITRAKTTYIKKGYDTAWIAQRLKNIDSRKELTDNWKQRGAKTSKDYAILTDEIYKNTFDLSTKQYKELKGINNTKRNLRDSMNKLELAITNLAEVTANEMHDINDSKGIENLKTDVVKSGKIAGETRERIECELGKKIATKDNYMELTNKETKRLNNRS